jgi:hypothetical protein
MSLKQFIADAYSKTTASVTKDNELKVISASYPPLAEQKVRPFRRFLTDDGLSNGTKDMAVDGSSTNVDYYVPASVSDDRYITTLNFIVGYGSSGKPNEWADGTALTNGCRLFYTSVRGEVDIHEGIKTNQDFFRLSFAPIPTAWEVRHVNATNDFGYFITLDLTKLGLPFGVKLDRGTQQRLTMRIRDNAGTDADSFDCIAYGFDRFE